jgi:predicted negative regulator of RcsB-dependent stress response
VNRLREWFHDHPFLTVWLAMAAIVVLVSYIGFQQREDQNHRACRTVEALTNALIRTATQQLDTPEKKAETQHRIDLFEADLEQRVGSGCDLHLLRVEK